MLAKLRLLLPSLILLTLFACMWGGSTQPEQAPIAGSEAKKTPAQQIVLAELFTSQGCSSCPPADAVLQRLAADHQNGELPVIALSYHVDYWNRLGWRDPYSDAAFSERQRQYAQHINDQGVYTPQLVINGQSGHIGSREQAVRNALATASQRATGIAIQKQIDWQSDAGQAIITYELSEARAGTTLQIAVVEKKVDNEVSRGENRGKHLSHTNVVRQLISQSNASLSGKVSVELLPELHAKQDNLAIYLFVQDTKTMAILGAG